MASGLSNITGSQPISEPTKTVKTGVIPQKVVQVPWDKYGGKNLPIPQRPTYDYKTGVYTDQWGNKTSVPRDKVPPGTLPSNFGGGGSQPVNPQLPQSVATPEQLAKYPGVPSNQTLIQQEKISNVAYGRGMYTADRIQSGVITKAELPFGSGFKFNEWNKPVTKDNLGEFQEFLKKIKGYNQNIKEQQKKTYEERKAEAKVSAEIPKESEGVIYTVPNIKEDIKGVEVRYKDANIDRLATKTEYDYYKSQTGILQAKTTKVYLPYEKTKDYVIRSYGILEKDLSSGITKPVLSKVSSLTGFDITKSKDIKKAIDISQIENFNPILRLEPVKEFISGAISESSIDIRDKPFKNILLFSAGYGLGAGYKGTATLLTKVPKIGQESSMLFKIGAVSLGLYMTGENLYASSKDIATSKSFTEAGSKTGVIAKDFIIMGAGFGAGETGFYKAQGYLMTRGRTEIPIHKLDPDYYIRSEGKLPYARTIKEEVKLFKETGGGYHVTDVKFWKDIITPKPGTSEFPGLYTSYVPSFYFAKVEGTGSGYSLNFIKEIARFEGFPGTAFLEPKGIRYNPYISTPTKMYGRTYLQFSNSVKPGYLDIPGLKVGREAEAIARVGSGDYGLINKKYYFTYKKIKIPIDKFGYKEPGTSLKELKSKGGYSYPYKTIKTYPITSKYNPMKENNISYSKVNINKSSYKEPIRLSKPYTVSGNISSSRNSVSSLIKYEPTGYKTQKYNPSIKYSYEKYYKIPAGSTEIVITTTDYPKKPYEKNGYNKNLSFDFGTRKRFNKKELGYDVFKIKKGKPVTIGKGLYKASALDIGARETLKDLTATFGIRLSDISPRDVATNKEFTKTFNLFRRPTAKSKYRQYGDVFVQRQTRVPGGRGRLTTRGELKDIQSARLNKLMMVIR